MGLLACHSKVVNLYLGLYALIWVAYIGMIARTRDGGDNTAIYQFSTDRIATAYKA